MQELTAHLGVYACSQQGAELRRPCEFELKNLKI